MCYSQSRGEDATEAWLRHGVAQSESRKNKPAERAERAERAEPVNGIQARQGKALARALTCLGLISSSPSPSAIYEDYDMIDLHAK